MPKSAPRNLSPSMKMGMLKHSMVMPAGKPVRFFTMTAMPEIPPGAILWGSKNSTSAKAKIADPTVMTAYWAIFSFRLNTKILSRISPPIISSLPSIKGPPASQARSRGGRVRLFGTKHPYYARQIYI